MKYLLFNSNAVIQAFIATLFTWFITTLGSSLVFCFKKVNKLILDIMLSMSAGVMISASFWSLLNPSLEMALKLNMNPWFVTMIGFICGGLFLFFGDKVFDYYKSKNKLLTSNIKRSAMLLFSITLHNIPEGLAIGVAFGSISYGFEGATIISAWLIALGIGLQNFPEGSAISLPLLRDGMSKKNAFLLGSVSGIVEPISGIIGALLVLKVRLLLPFLLSFAAGAMIYVVTKELIPESQENEKKDLMALFSILGFIVMMILDVAFS